MKTPENIRALRTKHRLTRHEFGRVVYASQRAVSSWENNEREMPQGLWELALITLEKIEPNMPEFISPRQLEIEL